MKEQESSANSVIEQKAKIRSRYQGINPSLLVVLPAKTENNLYDDTVHRRVAVYARVSTDDPHQTSSYELQKNYYEDYVSRHPNWELVGIYADEGISGTSLHHRDAFKRMIDDCMNDKIDMIVTKSVSRFSRNMQRTHSSVDFSLITDTGRQRLHDELKRLICAADTLNSLLEVENHGI